jgi:spore coat polysaccharide biosynthesis predicted glycosyltransferase SpsG
MPQERLIASQGSVRAAEEVGAEKVPAAALHLQLAREQIEQAKKFMQQGANVRADYVLQRASTDAELALSLAREAPLRAQAQHAIDKLQALKAKVTQ